MHNDYIPKVSGSLTNHLYDIKALSAPLPIQSAIYERKYLRGSL